MKIPVVILILLTFSLFATGKDSSDILEKRSEELLAQVPDATRAVDDLDLSKETTEELVNRIIRSEGQIFTPLYQKINRVLSSRGDLESVITNKYNSSTMDVYGLLGGYASIAELVSRDFKIEIIKKSIFHPSSKTHGVATLPQLFALLDRASDKDETLVLDSLIAEGRLEKGSELEITWRKKFTKHPSRPERRKPQGNKERKIEDRGQDFPYFDAITKSRTSVALLIAGCLLVFAILFLLTRVWIRIR